MVITLSNMVSFVHFLYISILILECLVLLRCETLISPIHFVLFKTGLNRLVSTSTVSDFINMILHLIHLFIHKVSLIFDDINMI